MGGQHSKKSPGMSKLENLQAEWVRTWKQPATKTSSDTELATAKHCHTKDGLGRVIQVTNETLMLQAEMLSEVEANDKTSRTEIPPNNDMLPLLTQPALDMIQEKSSDVQVACDTEFLEASPNDGTSLVAEVNSTAVDIQGPGMPPAPVDAAEIATVEEASSKALGETAEVEEAAPLKECDGGCHDVPRALMRALVDCLDMPPLHMSDVWLKMPPDVRDTVASTGEHAATTTQAWCGGLESTDLSKNMPDEQNREASAEPPTRIVKEENVDAEISSVGNSRLLPWFEKKTFQ